MSASLTITQHDELTYERLIASLPEPAQQALRDEARRQGKHVVHVIKSAILAFADTFQHLRAAA